MLINITTNQVYDNASKHYYKQVYDNDNKHYYKPSI